jgi:hypothetical protein
MMPPDPASLALRVDWQAAVGEGRAWSQEALRRHVHRALSSEPDLALKLSPDAVHYDGVRR